MYTFRPNSSLLLTVPELQDLFQKRKALDTGSRCSHCSAFHLGGAILTSNLF